MSLHHRRLTTYGTAFVLACAVSQPAFAGGTDLRSPDSQDGHRSAPALVDHRSPDTVDLASGRVVVPEPVVSITSKQTGFDWGDAGIGAGGALALVLLALGATMIATHRRRGVKPPRAVAH
jgi:hypothetical protein